MSPGHFYTRVVSLCSWVFLSVANEMCPIKRRWSRQGHSEGKDGFLFMLFSFRICMEPKISHILFHI